MPIPTSITSIPMTIPAIAPPPIPPSPDDEDYKFLLPPSVGF